MHSSNRYRSFALAIACILLINCKGDQETTAWSGFYGTFKGSAESVISGELSERELTVVIKPWKDKGFTVEWTTLIHRANDKKKMTDLSINFYPSSRPGIYASAMRTDVFGQAVPYDPVGEDADPYVWAGIEGDSLTVSALYILSGGHHEMHLYKRSLNENGLSLDFERLNNGEKVAKVAAQLESVE